MREVKPAMGREAAMGYSYRVRIESMIENKYYFFGKKIPFYRWVLERKHIAWRIEENGPWTPDKEKAIQWGNQLLDEIEKSPEGEYI